MSHTAQPGREAYLDHAAFSPVHSDVLSAILPYYEEGYGNPSSLHARGRNAKRAMEKARERCALALSVEKEEIIFTSGGTEANNLAILGIARANRFRGNHIVVSAIEHPSVLEAARQLEKEGFAVSYAPVFPNGTCDVDACMKLVTNATILVSLMYVNNEIGTIQPVERLALRLRTLPNPPLLHTDACQAGNVLSLSPHDLGVDLMTINSSKLGGPSGIGCLYKKEGVAIEPLVRGGEQEKGLRAGTENVPLLIGFSLALAKAQRSYKEENVRLEGLRNYFMHELRERVPDIHIHGDDDTQSPAIVHVTVSRIEGEAILLMLDDRGIYASTGSACASMQLAPSHVLRAIGHDLDSIHGSLRFSFGRGTTKEDLDYVLENFPTIAERLCSMTAIKKTS